MDSTQRPIWEARAGIITLSVLGVLALALLFLNVDLLTRMGLDGSNPGTVILGGVLVAIVASVWVILHNRKRQRRFQERLEAWAAERAVHEERLQIARDLHDLASHGLGLITVRAATARLLVDDDTDGYRRALSDIERVGREATDELRQMLTILRSTTPAAAPLHPADSLNDLPAIVTAASRSGLTVNERLQDLGTVPASIQLTICRVLREALTNAARHAGPTTVDVTLGRQGHAIHLDVQDHGPAHSAWRPHRGSGHGLAGLRERLSIHDGTLTTGQTAAGFRLLATIPVGEAS